MAFDPNAICPGGTGKKVKFCCPDLVGELEKIHRMLEGDQRVACLEHIERIEAKYPRRACLLAIKVMLLGQMNRIEDAKKTLEVFFEAHPNNPVAYAESAQIQAGEDVREAVRLLQRALELSAGRITTQVYDALSVVAQALIEQGFVLAARGHLLFLAGIEQAEESQAMALLIRLNSAPGMPLLWKEDPRWGEAPPGVPWKEELDDALRTALTGAWMAAERKFAALAQRVPDSPEVWRNLAILRGWLADNAGAVEALRRYASLKVPLDDAVEAEALAQTLDEHSGGEPIDMLRVVYPVKDLQELESRLSSDARISRAPVNPATWSQLGEPPPRMTALLLDKPLPRSGKDLTLESVPNVIGQALLFGRQTDREARLELLMSRNEKPAAEQLLKEVAGDAIGPEQEEQVLTQTSTTAELMYAKWRLPEDAPIEVRHRLIVEQHKDAILNKWPNAPLQLFGGKTAAEAAKDESNRIKLLAAILNLELASTPSVAGDVFNELRKKLGLSVPPFIDPADADLLRLPLARLHRLVIPRLSDEQMVAVYRRGVFFMVRRFLVQIIPAMLARESLARQIDREEALGLLVHLEEDPDQALKYAEQGRQAALAAKKSCARWDLEELRLRIERHELDQLERLIRHIDSQHSREPGVAQALVGLLYEHGLIAPGQVPAAAPMAPDEGGAGIVVPGSAATAPGAIWTPGSEQGGGQEKKLWVPGME